MILRQGNNKAFAGFGPVPIPPPRPWLYVAWLLTFLLTASANLWAADITEHKGQKDILILHSFHKGHGWSDGIDKGIASIFEKSGHSIQLFHEYMDSKRIFDNTHIDNVYRLFKHKFANHRFDAAIVTNDPAFQFMLKYYSRLLPSTPVIFCGVNYFEKYALYGQANFTGLLERIDIEDTLDTAIAINPEVRHAFVIVDKTPISVAVIQSFLKILHKYAHQLSIYFTEDMTMRQLIEKVEALPSDSIAIIVNFTIDKSGNVFTLEDSTRMITERSQVPVFSFWDSYLGHGIVGGKLVSGYTQGKKTADLALSIFKGRQPHSIPVISQSTNEYMFDHSVLKRFSINPGHLPKGSLIVNQPVTFYSQHKQLIWITAAGIAGLSLIILVLSFNIFRRVKAESNLKRYSKRLEIINRIDRAILEATPTEEIAHHVLKYVRNLFACKRVSIILFDYNRHEALVLSVDAEGETAVDEGSTFSLNDYHVEELKSGKIVALEDIQSLANKSVVDLTLLSESISSLVMIPLFYDGHLIGSLNFGNDKYALFNEENIKIAKQIAAPFAIAIQNAKLLRKLLRRENDLKRMSARMIKSQEDERKKISLEIHDELGQALTAIHMNLSIIEKNLVNGRESDGLLEMLKETIAYVQTMAEQLQYLSHTLRPPLLDVLGLIPALKSHINGIRKRTQMEIIMESENCEQRFLPDIEINLFRIIQESLHNIVKHAHAKHAGVRLAIAKGCLQINIDDDGIGLAQSGLEKSAGSDTGIGIMGMQERVSNLGGTFSISSRASGGTRILVEIPLKPPSIG
jgi:signal transduction histidine kinase